jgi:putative ABC transport system permease protein
VTATDITFAGMVFCFLLLLIPVIVSYYLRLKLVNEILESAFRMTVQLVFVGFFLTFVFDLNSSLLNILWVIFMAVVASYTVLKSVQLKYGSLILPLILSSAATNIGMLLYFNSFVIGLSDLFEARCFIPIAGMVIGNSLRANIVGINDFCDQIQRKRTSTCSACPGVRKSMRPSNHT